MNAVGIVVEYNPFHNGHGFHLQETKNKTNADVIIAVMSGSFLQRGEPALLPKWTRTKMALMAGVDIVLELPYAFCTQNADTFASGAVQILTAAGCTSLCFGSENGNIDHFHATYQFLKEHQDDYQQKIKHHIKNGVSYPRAQSLAFLDLNPSNLIVDLSKPNNILGYQYLKAVKQQNPSMEIYTISRTNNYHDEQLGLGSIASATSIRKALFSEGARIENIQSYVPSTTYKLLVDYYDQYHQFQQWENYWQLLRYKLLSSSPSELRNIYDMVEGLENRLIRVALEANSFFEFMTRLKTKRYTWTRLQRMCVHILTNTSYEEMKKRMKMASYIRLLGMNERGRSYLNKWKSHSSLPIVSKVASFKNSDIELDIQASRIYALGATKHKQQELLQMEYTQPPIYLSDYE